MELGKEVLDALVLTKGELVIKHWKYHHYTCVLTNQRIALLSPHHILGHPHREVSWSQYLQEISVIEVQKMGDVGAAQTYSFTSYRPAGGGVRGYSPGVPMAGAKNTVTLAGDYGLHVDNVVVFTGGPDDAANLRDVIESAAQSRRQELGVPLKQS
jgi:hypothetical protein